MPGLQRGARLRFDYIVAILTPSGIVTLLTDFGSEDHYVGVMKGVILRICPEAKIVDLCHDLSAYSIPKAAFLLAQSYRYFAPGTVHVVVVDPGVGSARRALAARAGEHYFIAPDNGVLSHALEREESAQFRQIDQERFGLQPLSRTFHGRDLFSPAAAHLASGVSFEGIGSAVEKVERLSSTIPVELESGGWRGCVLNIDRFGNIVTSLPTELAGTALRFRVGKLTVTRRAESYAGAKANEPFVIQGSSGFLEVSINQGDAAKESGAGIGDPIEAEPI